MVIIYLLAVIPILAPTELPAESIRGKELVGFRLGTVFNSGELDRAFGRGSSLEIHFLEGLGSSYGINISLSSHGFGEAKIQKNNSISELQIYSLTAGFLYRLNIAGSYFLSAEAGPGIYAVTLIKPGFIELYSNDYQPGLYGGIAALYKLGSNNIYLELSGKYHYIFSGDNQSDIIYYYTGRNRADFFQICIGVILRSGN
ncbi:MAG: hypothetical protein GF417_05695 [Candidatus Latescibacteria bacterium]|nr:hypothetical protein [bacterium]MBD3423909.1 hypothetical protein [Candidatus Latescibacterota bacterium]